MAMAILKQLLHSSKSGAREPESGMTLIELLVVVLMVGILATGLGVSWTSFVNRQRISRFNNAVRQAIEQAQREAKGKKISYSVEFRQNAGARPEVNMGGTGWRVLAEGLDIEANQVEFTSSGATKITFDHQGTVVEPSSSSSLPLYLTVAESGGADITKRCVIIETLLGTTRTNSGSDCNTTPP